MLEMVQHASFRIDSLALLRRCSRHGKAEQFSTTCEARTDLGVTDSSGKCEVHLCSSSAHLCLNVISSDDVSDGSQCGRGHLVVGVPAEKRRLSRSSGAQVHADGARPRLHEQLHEAPADAGVDDGLDLVVGAVGEIRQSPASVRQQVWVAAEQKPGQHRQAGRHLKHARRLGAAETARFLPKGVATFSNAGGGFFPLQRLDRAQTAFLVMVSLVDLVRSLSRESGISASAPAAVHSPRGGEDGRTSTAGGGCCSSARSLGTPRCRLRCYPKPTPPAEYKHTGVTSTAHEGPNAASVPVQRGHLLLDVLKVRVEQFYEDGHGAGLDHRLRLHGRARGDVG